MDLINSWREEMRAAYLYQVMANDEQNASHKKLFLELQKTAEKQAFLWEKKIKQKIPDFSYEYSPSYKTRFIVKLIRLLGVERLRFFLSAMKIRGMSIFAQHDRLEHKHTSFTAASNLRAAIFGINDGLISNMSLILGIAGANLSHHIIILIGISGLLAGAFSMGAGEYISVRSQREVFEYQIEIEKQELNEYPQEEIEELSLIYQARGLPLEEADKLAHLMISNPNTALDTLVREELGINPDDMVSPIGAMISSFISFTIGAIIPLLPFFFGGHYFNLLISVFLTAMTLFLIGALLSLLTNRHPLLLGIRMLLIGAIAGSITFIIGRLLGTNLIM